MSDDQTAHPALPMPVALPAPPAEVTEAATALRVACAKWAPNPGTNSYYKTEVSACDVVLNRDHQFPLGATLGVLGTLVVVAFIGITRNVICASAGGRADTVAVFGILALLGAISGYVASWPLTSHFADVWSDSQSHLAVAGCIVAMVGLLAALRWNRQRGVAA